MGSSHPTLCCSIAASASKVGVATHLAGYRALGMDWSYVAFSLDDTDQAMASVRALGIRGCGVTMPHKEAVLPLLDAVDDDAAAIGAVNTIVNDVSVPGGHLTGYNTDWAGATRALEEVTELGGRRVALLGAGGAGRALAYACKRAGAEVTVFNRTAERAAELAGDLGLAGSGGVDELDTATFDLLVNSTSVGYRDPDATPVDAARLRADMVVMDVVAEPLESRLLREAADAGATVVPGWKMRLYQAAAQFSLYTGRDAPVEAMQAAMLEALGG
jgi:shikimate dehydrogenase